MPTVYTSSVTTSQTWPSFFSTLGADQHALINLVVMHTVASGDRKKSEYCAPCHDCAIAGIAEIRDLEDSCSMVAVLCMGYFYKE